MKLPRIFLGLIAIVWIAGCSTVATGPSRAQAVQWAKQYVRAKYTSSFQMTGSRYDPDRQAWEVDFERVPEKPNETPFDHNWLGVVVRSPTDISSIVQ
jgi:hypothetical protein